ncbi:hypothetical protein AAVH_09341 [Aphelenchoides avenae]|nr:hypothetical protein AAVH_09341 [Aphelenchus avenae]
MVEEEVEPAKTELSFVTLRRIRELQLEATRQEAVAATEQQQLRDRVKQLEDALSKESTKTRSLKKKLSRIAAELTLLNARIINAAGVSWKPNLRLPQDAQRAGIVASIHRITAELNMLAHIDVMPVDEAATLFIALANAGPSSAYLELKNLDAPQPSSRTQGTQAGAKTTKRGVLAVPKMTHRSTQTSTEVVDSPLTQLRDIVYATLFGEVMGYSDIRLLLQHIIEDSGIDAEERARTLGYKSFVDFLSSDEMSSKVHASETLGTIVYYAIPTAQNFHQRLEQLKSVVEATTKRVRRAKNRAPKAVTVARRRGRKATRKERKTDLEELIRASQANVQDAEERLRATHEQLRHYEKAFGCLCRDSCVEVIYGYGHGCCTKCDEKWTKRDAEDERPVDPAARFLPNAGVPSVYGTGPPTCPWCRTVITARTKVY